MSEDGISWTRVPDNEAVFGRPGEFTYMSSVTAGGPGLVAVGGESPVGESPDVVVCLSGD